MDEGQTVHGIKPNVRVIKLFFTLSITIIRVTNQPDSDEVPAHCAEPNDPATKVTNKPDSNEVDAARPYAREAVSGLNPVFGPVQAVASGINDAVDYVTPLLGTVSKFNFIVDTVAEIHPYAKAAWGVLPSSLRWLATSLSGNLVKNEWRIYVSQRDRPGEHQDNENRRYEDMSADARVFLFHSRLLQEQEFLDEARKKCRIGN
ncbi:hypothetical protein DEU56DRAFT_932359 [Suillus clintonianus]|uniref:uncharacterized protein n=1 Tax=Suillus clintonianus TaxID=1904413 RepID=UPI001B8796E7|nr:uncharacterized protein DEU56DRAFT_932359 [Suillus clintonianus]KAG2116268.1 hypothetical protein DEU56DRAFT_932359 [Suillus clintonianus]